MVKTKAVPATNNKFKLTQSMIKSLFDVNEGSECGLVFKAKFLDGKFDLFTASTVQSVGTWFEFMVTGALPKDGKIPQPQLTSKNELTAPFKKIEAHIDNFKNVFNHYGIKIVSSGDVIKHNDLEGTIDILALATKDIADENGEVIVKAKQQFIIDIKTTGLLDDKWNDYGWELNNLANKTKLILQPIHYRYIWLRKTGEEIPFLFFLFSSTNPDDYRIINFTFGESTYLGHTNLINKVLKLYLYYEEKGFPAHPSPIRCGGCPLKGDCKSAVDVPFIQTFNYDAANG
jgi:hypothetical protein